MPLQFSEKIRNEPLNVVAWALGPAAVMKIYSGECPSSCAAANPSGELVEIELPRRPFIAPNSTKMMIAEPWSGFAHADGVVRSFRVFDYLGEPHLQGSISKLGEGGDMQLETVEVHAGQKVAIGSFSLFEPDAPISDEQMQKDLDEELRRRQGEKEGSYQEVKRAVDEEEQRRKQQKSSR
jgi:hypothetical protein